MQIAIIGMAGRFPGAPDLDAFWRLLCDGRDAVGPLPADRWDPSDATVPEREVPAVGCFLDDIDRFDAAFFGISPREAAVLDPQQYLVLETGWSALEDAGLRAADLRGSRTGVYVGNIWHDNELLRKDRGRPTTQHSIVGNAIENVAARLSHVLGLTGPSFVVGSGCSSSLVALHLAGQALATGEVEGALVGGANVMLHPDVQVGLTHFGGLSPTGRCRPFGAGADGFVRGEGVVAVYLKPLDRALRDGDRVRAVLVAGAVNNDGGGDSMSAPNTSAQEALLREVYGSGGVPAERLAYVEAHGTGTARGDVAEAGSLGRALGRRGRPLPIGSVKSNVGHLETVAGLAGVVKSVLALENGLVPPSLHADRLNPEIDFAGLGLDVVREPLPLPPGEDVLIGVNSFGWGGTNAHVVLGRPPARATTRPDAPDRGPFLLPVSAHSGPALRQRVDEVLAHLAAGADAREAARGLSWHRDHFPERSAFVVDGTEDAPTEPAAAVTGRARAVGRVAFVFPGQGAQWPGMGAGLYGADPTFTASVDRCAQALSAHVAWDLRAVLTGRESAECLSRVDVVQPALWAVSVSLAAVWRAAGVHPDLVIGHSQGEIAAATVAGALSVTDAALVVARRSAELRSVAGRGRMLAVELDRDAALAALDGFADAVALAVHNGPRSCVLSGDTDTLLLLREILEADEVFCRLVEVDYASHSPQIEPLLPRVRAALQDVRPRRGEVQMLSTVDLRRLVGTELGPTYWADNLRRPVRFADAVQTALDDGVTHLVEVSPHPGLSAALAQIGDGRDEPPVVLSTLRRDQGAPADLARARARAWVSGLSSLGTRPPGRPEQLPPPYPWQRERYAPGDRGRRARGVAPLELTLLPVPEGTSWLAVGEVSLADHPWLAEHRVGDAVVFPAGGHLALLERAVGEVLGTRPVHLRDLVLPGALTPPDTGAVRVSAVWRPAGQDGGTATVASLDAEETRWRQHCHLRVDRTGPSGPPVVFPGSLLAVAPLTATQFYTACDRRGLHYGPAFRAVERVHVDGTEALARLAVPRTGGRTALWDAVLQAALALQPGAGPVVPTALRHAVLDDAGPGGLWAHARPGSAGGVDIVVFDARRSTVGRVEGLVLTPLPGEGDRAGSDRVLRMRLEPAGPAKPGPPVDRLVVCGPSATNVARLTAGLPGARAVVLGTDPLPACDALVFAAPCGVEAQRAGLAVLARLVAECLERLPSVSITVVTGTSTAAPDGSGVEPGAALYAGFAAVLRSEHPEFRVRLVDIDAVTPALAAELLDADGEDVVVLRGDHRWVGRRERGTPAPDEPPPWTTGGQGGAFRLAAGRPGRLDSLLRRPIARRAPGPGEVEVEVGAAALNFLDVMKVLGVYPDPADADLLGMECVGTVTAVGRDVTHLRVGDRAVACGPGSLASHVTVDARLAWPVADGTSRAATLPMVLVTAWLALVEIARIRRGETVLVHSGAGGVGLAAITVARRHGALVLATAGTEAKRQHLRDLGVGHVFDSRSLQWVEEVRAATGGRGVDVVLNSLAGAAIPAGLDVLADDGRFVELGKRDVHGGGSIDLRAFRGAASFAAVDVAGLLRRDPDRFAALLRRVLREVEQDRLDPPPVTEHPFADAEAALRALGSGEQVGKIVLVDPRDGGPEAPDPRIRPGATYLVTGGRGALGLSLAEFLVEQGADAIALVGRSEPAPEVAARITALRDRGAAVGSWCADVADERAMAEVLTEVRAELPELRGVLHAAGVLDDATAAAVTEEQVRRVLAPKFDGALVLDRLTADDPLDLFVLFSSVAAFVGTPGQAAYAAANAGLDALAARRRRAGRAALSVQWGPVADVGLAADRRDRGARLADRGLAAVPVAECWPALWRFLGAGEVVVGHAALDPHRWAQTHPAVAALPSWQPLLADGPAQPTGGLAARLRMLSGPARRELVESVVRRDAASVLMVDDAVLARDRDAALSGMGLDSLMTIELRNRLESSLGLRLSPTLLWKHGTVARLGTALAEQLDAGSAAG